MLLFSYDLWNWIIIFSYIGFILALFLPIGHESKLSKSLCILTVCIYIISNIFSIMGQNIKVPQDDISNRIETISANLQESSTELTAIQKELGERIKFVDALKEEAEIAENVISLTSEQVAAVQAKLNQELELNNKRSFWPNSFNDLFFCLLGVAIPVLGSFIWRKIKGKIKAEHNKSTYTYSDDELAKAVELLKAIEQSKATDDPQQH